MLKAGKEEAEAEVKELVAEAQQAHTMGAHIGKDS
jgi:hypothetical protein